MNTGNYSNLISVRIFNRRMDNMSSGIFFVAVRDDYEQARRDYFPYIASTYTAIAKNFKKGKSYPVLSIKHATLIADDEKNVETSQFLVPTENGNFIWVQSEIFRFVGLEPENN
jgi:hypothetical protein